MINLYCLKARLNNVTCDAVPPMLPTNTTGNGGTDNDGTDDGVTECDNTDCDGTDYGHARGGTTIHHPIVGSFYILMISTLLLVLAID